MRLEKTDLSNIKILSGSRLYVMVMQGLAAGEYNYLSCFFFFLILISRFKAFALSFRFEYQCFLYGNEYPKVDVKRLDGQTDGRVQPIGILKSNHVSYNLIM